MISGLTIVFVQEALDVWSLGVMAFELLTGKPALRMHEGKDQVCCLFPVEHLLLILMLD